MLDSGHAVSTQRLMLNMAKQLTKAGNAAGAKAAGKGAKVFGLVEMLQSGSTFRGASAATEPPRRWKSTDGPLSGTTVLDCSVQLAGSMAAMVLADQGAETIQAELPGGGGGGARQLGQQPSSSTTDLGAMHMVLNRNKKSFALCEGGEEALAAELLGLCRLADVVFVDEGCPTTSSLTYDSARGVNPSIIFVSISHGGGEWAVQARSGQCADQLDADGQPTTVRSLVNEKSAAMYAAAAATAALLARGRGLGGSVAGQAAKVDMLGVALHSCQTDTLMNHLWHKKGGSGAARFPTIGDCYRTGELSDGTNVFVLALSNQECADFVAAFEEKISPEVRAVVGPNVIRAHEVELCLCTSSRPRLTGTSWGRVGRSEPSWRLASGKKFRGAFVIWTSYGRGSSMSSGTTTGPSSRSVAKSTPSRTARCSERPMKSYKMRRLWRTISWRRWRAVQAHIALHALLPNFQPHHAPYAMLHHFWASTRLS
jgi:crotonobetainyl-CoA:carnitine CoA-transferase CaiB-like acyl-CoA transferase